MAADVEMVRALRMRSSMGLNRNGVRSPIYGPGTNILMPRSVADGLGLKWRPDYESWTVAQLRAEAERMNLEVTRGDGTNAAPVRADYLRAVSEAGSFARNRPAQASTREQGDSGASTEGETLTGDGSGETLPPAPGGEGDGDD